MSDQRPGLWSSTACAQFEVRHFESGWEASQKMSRREGSRGGKWTACTHLKIFGINTAPFFMRFLAYALQPRSAFELGCGLGTTADYVSRFTPGGSEVTCAEPEPMLSEIFGQRALPKRPTQLSVNLFQNSSRGCLEALSARQFELVYSLEVAEHIPALLRPILVKALSSMASRYLVFSAARPGQAGVGHAPQKQISWKSWVKLFEAEGFTHALELTRRARQLAWPDRCFDLFRNVVVLLAPGINVGATANLVAQRMADHQRLLNRSLIWPEKPNWWWNSSADSCMSTTRRWTNRLRTHFENETFPALSQLRWARTLTCAT
jgi:SAM-dependent methyltransferase|eukprot:146358-Prymnesium_polylepis.1